MMTRLFVLVSSLVFVIQIGYGQINGTPEPCTDGNQNTCICDDAPVLCTIGELDGYSYEMTTYLHPDDGPDLSLIHI